MDNVSAIVDRRLAIGRSSTPTTRLLSLIEAIAKKTVFFAAKPGGRAWVA